MTYRTIKYGMYKKEIRKGLNEKLKLKDRIMYHEKKIKHHVMRISEIKNNCLRKVIVDLNYYLTITGNKEFGDKKR